MILDGWIELKIKRGLIFWMVKRTNKIIHGKDSTILGIQAWKGAAPNLILILKRIRKSTRNFKFKVSSGNEIAIKKIIEANVCLKKYLIAFSLLNVLFDLNKRGIKLSVLSSRASQFRKIDALEQTIAILKITDLKNKKSIGDANIWREG